MVTLRSLAYLLFMGITVIIYSVPLSIFGWFIPYIWVARAGRSWGRINLAALETICGLSFELRGWEHVPSTNCIVLCKHQSAWETIALRALLPAEHTWVIKRELLRVPFFGWGIAPFRPIAIDRRAGRRAIKDMLQDGKRWLDRGRWVVIFPEGTRVAPGKRKRYGHGGAILAAKSGYPVLPIAHNAGVFWRRRGIKKYPGTIDLVIGKPIETKGRSASDINREVEDWIENVVLSLPAERPQDATS